VVLAFKSNFWKSATPKGKYIGYASQQKGEYYMFIDISDCASLPTLLALVSGSQALALEKSEDANIVAGALRVLRLILGEHMLSSTNYYYVTMCSVQLTTACAAAHPRGGTRGGADRVPDHQMGPGPLLSRLLLIRIRYANNSRSLFPMY
jgi:monoamine oxidase